MIFDSPIDIIREGHAPVRDVGSPSVCPLNYRVILQITYLIVAAVTMYKGYKEVGPGWLLLGLPFAVLFALLAVGVILRTFPPKLEAHAEGNTWLKLT
ncbi:MAG TPA: hypothetical protein VEH30_14535 [Terriglobales bacterium]|nr:hypothetical protein [Terriglobales bacterium]